MGLTLGERSTIFQVLVLIKALISSCIAFFQQSCLFASVKVLGSVCVWRDIGKQEWEYEILAYANNWKYDKEKMMYVWS